MTGTNNVALGKGHVKVIVDTMKGATSRRMKGMITSLLRTLAPCRNFKDELETVHQYTTEGFGLIANGEIGRYENTRFVEQTNIAKATWTNTKSNWAYFFGADTVAEGVAVPEEMRGKMRLTTVVRVVLQYYLGGFGLVHTAAAQARL